MASPSFKTTAGAAGTNAEGWLMAKLRALRAALRRPRKVTPTELSPHLLRDIGLHEVAGRHWSGEP